MKSKIFVAVLFAIIFILPGGSAQPYDKAAFADMRWRPVGPFRGGRTKAITGVPHEPNVPAAG